MAPSTSFENVYVDGSCSTLPAPRQGTIASVRKWTDLEPELCRSRGGVRPISARNWTDLDAEYDRSRRKGRGVVRRGQDELVARRGQPGLGLLQAEDEHRLIVLSILVLG